MIDIAILDCGNQKTKCHICNKEIPLGNIDEHYKIDHIDAFVEQELERRIKEDLIEEEEYTLYNTCFIGKCTYHAKDRKDFLAHIQTCARDSALGHGIDIEEDPIGLA